MIELYHHPLSTFARRVRMALIEKGIEYQSIEVDMPAGEHRQSAFLGLNPYGRVPVIKDGDFVLYESGAILNYLEATHPEPALLPADLKARAQVDMHMRLCDLQMGRQAGVVIFPKRFLPREEWDMEAIDIARDEIERHLAILGKQLAGHQYLVGNELTLADLSYAPFLEFLSLMDVTTPQEVLTWSRRLLTRASALQTKPSN